MDRCPCLPQHLLERINRLYEASNISDLACALFDVQPGYDWNCAAEDISLYLERYMLLDPFVAA